mgnify:FL=1
MSPLVRQRRTESSAPGKAHGQFLGEDCLIASPGAQDMNLMPTWGHPADVPLTAVNFTLQTAFVT